MKISRIDVETIEEAIERHIKWLEDKLWTIEFIEIEFEKEKSERIRITLNFIKTKLILMNESWWIKLMKNENWWW